MQTRSIVHLNRRSLLTGVAAVTATAVVAPHVTALVDRLVERDGWLLKESDLA